MTRCPKCQRQVPADSRFCTNCGTPIAPAQVQQPVQPQYQPPVRQPVQTSYQPPVQPQPKKKKGLAALIIVAVVLVAALIGGGIWAITSGIFDGDSDVHVSDRDNDKNRPGDSEAQGNTAVEQPPVAEATGPVELTIWVSDLYLESLDRAIDSFLEAYPDIALSVEMRAVSEADILTELRNNPTGADIYVFPDDQLRQLAEAGLLANLDAYKDYVNDDSAASVETATLNGSLYALPMTASNGYFMYYDSNFFTAEDVESLEVMCEKAAAAGKKVVVPIENGWYLYSFFAGAGLELTETSCNWNCDTGVNVCKSILNLVETGGLAPYTQGYSAAVHHGDDVAAVISGTWDASGLRDYFGDGYACAKLPCYDLNGKAVQMASFCGCKLMGINPATENLDVAVFLAEWLTNGENQLIRFEMTHDAPTHVDAAVEAIAMGTPEISALIAQSDYARAQRVGSGYWVAAETLGVLLAQGNSGDVELDSLLDDIVASMGY